MSVPQRPGPCPHCDDDHVKAACLAPFGVYGGCRSARVAFDAGAAWAEVKRLKAEIAWLNTEQAWRPIETAPTDGTRIMLLLPETYNYRIVTGQWVDAPRGTSDPTHWMPLPKVPQP